MAEKQDKPEDSLKTKLADMSADLVKEAKIIIKDNLEKHTNEKDIAYYIKRDMDRKHMPSWHCVAGRNFGLYVTHEEGYYLQVMKGQMTIIIWK